MQIHTQDTLSEWRLSIRSLRGHSITRNMRTHTQDTLTEWTLSTTVECRSLRGIVSLVICRYTLRTHSQSGDSALDHSGAIVSLVICRYTHRTHSQSGHSALDHSGAIVSLVICRYTRRTHSRSGHSAFQPGQKQWEERSGFAAGVLRSSPPPYTHRRKPGARLLQ